MKRVLPVVLSIALISSMSTNAFAAPYVNTENEVAQNSNDLTNLWLNGKSSFKLLEASSENRYFVSSFTVNGTTYQIEETVNENYDLIDSKFYKIRGTEKEYIGSQTTELSKHGNDVTVSISENGRLLDIQTYNMPENNVANSSLSGTDSVITPYAAIEAQWFSQGKVNGSNNIQRYTVAAIITLLGVAAGNPYAAGLSSIANTIILEQWETVYWTRETWIYMERCPDWPSYPDWVQAGKYKYYTEYYSDSARTDLIGTTSHTDG